MKTKRIFNLIILDESGSMESIKRPAINGFNETIQTIYLAQIRHDEQEHFVSLVTFNSDYIRTIYDKVAVENIKPLDEKSFQPNYCTPLYDAMGISLSTLKHSVESDDMVLVTIITDGEENSSSEFTGVMIKKQVEELKECGWVFTYIGTNQDVEKVAATISVTNVLNFDYSKKSTQQMFIKENQARSRFFDRVSECSSQETPIPIDNYFDKDEK